LKIRVDSQRDYWIETRRLLNTWLGPNLLIHWSPWGLSDGGSQLLDMTPDSAGGRYDAPLALGKSFYDPNLGLKITPWRLGGTSPESIDILVTHLHEVRVEAEAGELTAPMVIVSDQGASQGRYVWSPVLDQGGISFTIDVPSNGHDMVWCRVAELTGPAPVMVSVDGSQPETGLLSAGPSLEGWRWGRLVADAREDSFGTPSAPIFFALTAGPHVLRMLIGPGVKLDSLLITNDQAMETHPLPPRVSAQWETNGQVKITVAGVAGVNYLVEATSDFVTWETVGAVTNVTETSQITETVAAQHESRFYRAMAK